MSAVEAFDPWADLDAHMTDGLPEYSEDTEPPTLATTDEIERALRRLRVAQDRLRELEEVAKTNVEAVQAWLHDRSSVLLREIDWHTQAVENWHRAHVREGGAKTFSLPSGTLKLTQGRHRIEPLTKEPSEQVPADYVRTKVEWDKVAVAKHSAPGPLAEGVEAPDGFVAHWAVDANGERIPDVVRLVPVVDTFTVKVGG